MPWGLHRALRACVCVRALSGVGRLAGDDYTCLGQNPKCKTHQKARLHLRAALNVKIISQPSLLLRLQPAVVTL